MKPYDALDKANKGLNRVLGWMFRPFEIRWLGLLIDIFAKISLIFLFLAFPILLILLWLGF